jgi:hypothetical protein
VLKWSAAAAVVCLHSKHNLQEKADATAAVLSKYFGVKEKLFKEFKAEADAWLNNEVTLSKSMDFQGE